MSEFKSFNSHVLELFNFLLQKKNSSDEDVARIYEKYETNYVKKKIEAMEKAGFVHNFNNLVEQRKEDELSFSREDLLIIHRVNKNHMVQLLFKTESASEKQYGKHLIGSFEFEMEEVAQIDRNIEADIRTFDALNFTYIKPDRTLEQNSIQLQDIAQINYSPE